MHQPTKKVALLAIFTVSAVLKKKKENKCQVHHTQKTTVITLKLLCATE